MPENLFAACRVNGELVPKRVRLDGTIQDQIEAIFARQEEDFFEGADEEVPFDGGWKPDSNELLIMELTADAGMFRETLDMNANSVEDLDLANFATAGIKALFTGQDGVDGRVLVQRFTGVQLLSRKFAVFLQGDSFRRLTAPSFTLASSLAFVIDGDFIKFKSFSNLRSILDVQEIYRDATEQEVRDYAGHPNIQVLDLENFVLTADQPTRKLINAVISSGVLEDYTSAEIQVAAQSTQLAVEVENERIILPAERSAVKDLLRFLDESRYRGPLSGLPYVTNSRKRAQV